MRVLVLGANGMLGHKLLQCLATRHEVIGTLRRDARPFQGHPVLGKLPLLSGVHTDDFDTISRAVSHSRPDAIINAIGLIKQLPGAKDPIPSISINSLLPHRLAQLARNEGARFFHISTDCVFSGRRGNYTESDETDALDLYGRSKLLGEVDAPGSVTLRTSIVGRELESTSGLFEWFISQRGKSAKGFTRAIYTGLTTDALADVIAMILERYPDLHGLWQVSSEPINKFDLLTMLNRALRLQVDLQPETQFHCDRSLRSDRFRQTTGWQPPSWSSMIDRLAADPTPYDSIRRKA